ncbi:MAG: glycoside hydrolase family 25 protein [Ruminococcus sp.]|uniref:glycoside hydrolase family 25 protein n=1 Tax=Ruminococcus sp. TaxID=41978 RepID=UPI0025DDA4F0|nr:glycoside hydrolase family 25 protein [Ruminococcus sp.]MBO4867520.1 glycoside hydrolase family 25 protein [Ruminococcus sp.]
MKFIKAASGAVLAGIIIAGMSLTASADEVSKDIISASGETFDVNYANENEDAGYLKYKHNLIANRMAEMSPAGKIKKNYSTICGSFGSYLTHDSRFDGMNRTYLIDVSQWQGKIDWKKVKADGINDVIIRLGYRGYGSAGTLMMDNSFYENIKGAKAAGLKVGIYFYTQAISYAEARAEADFCAQALKGYTLDLPVYYDIESVDYDYGRLDHAGLTKAQKTKLCKEFCDRIESYGYESGVYANLYWLNNMINGPELGNDYKTWVAAYMSQLNYTGIYDMWQYSSNADINGISGSVDINVMYDVDYSPATTVKVKIEDGVLSWNKAAGADGYTVYGSDNGTDTYVVANVTGTSFSLNDQSAGKYCVAAYNYFSGKNYYGKKSNMVDSFRQAPADVEANRSGIDKVTVSWEAVPSAAGYEVYTVSDGITRMAGKTSDTSFEIRGKNLQNKQAFVRAYNKNGLNGELSDFVSLPGNAPAFVPYAEFRANRLVWTAIPDADGYIITRNLNGKVSELVVHDTYYYVDESKTADFYVQAYSELDGTQFRTEASNICSFKGVSYPPKGEIVLDSSSNGLSWNKIDDAIGYIVYKLADDGSEIEIGRVEGCRFNTDDTDATVFFVKGYNVKDGKEFYTESSNRVIISLPEVTEASLVSKTDDFAVISWNEIADCEEYMVYLDKGNGYELYTTVRGSMAMIGDLKDASFASVRVKGYVGDKNVVSFGLFSNQLYIIGDEKSRPSKEVLDFNDLLG